MAVGTSGIPVVQIRGKLGNVVFQRSGEGLMVREHVIPHDPKTAAQLAARRRMDRVAVLWRSLTDAEFAAWETFAAGQSGGTYRVYLGLTTRWLRLHPSGSPPSLPPSGPFFGDAVTLSLSSQALVRDEPLGAGALTVTASQANAAKVTTEILVQPLANTRRKPRDRDWTSAAYLTFSSGSLTQAVALKPGAYAVAYRFVRMDTGQATEMAFLGRVEVA